MTISKGSIKSASVVKIQHFWCYCNFLNSFTSTTMLLDWNWQGGHLEILNLIFYHFTKGLPVCTFSNSFNNVRTKALFNNVLIIIFWILLTKKIYNKGLQRTFCYHIPFFFIDSNRLTIKNAFFLFFFSQEKFMNWKKSFIDLTSLEGLFSICLDWLVFKRDEIVITCHQVE